MINFQNSLMTSIAFLLCFESLAASSPKSLPEAQTLARISQKRMEQTSSNETKAPSLANSPLQPIRQAKMRVQLNRMKFVKNGTHFEWKRDVVCERELAVNVYDFRVQSDGYIDDNFNILECTSELNGEPTLIRGGGMMALNQGRILSSDPLTDFKHVSAGFFLANTPSLPDEVRIFSATASTRDLNASSMALNVLPNVLVSCSESKDSPDQQDCSTNIPDYFQANVEFVD